MNMRAIRIGRVLVGDNPHLLHGRRGRCDSTHTDALLDRPAWKAHLGNDGHPILPAGIQPLKFRLALV
jgi:hypothetical protein